MALSRFKRAVASVARGVKGLALVIGFLIALLVVFFVLDALHAYRAVVLVVVAIPAVGLLLMVLLWGLMPFAWVYDRLRARRRSPGHR
jgi:uncharacterized membrane protein